MSEPRSDWPIFRWDFIEKIAANELSKLVGAIPIIGYLILFNDSLVSSLSFNRIAGVAGEINPPFFLNTVVKLRLAFFGSILVLVANIVFRLAGPKVLSHSKTDFDFANKVAGSYSVSEIHQIEREIFSEGWCRRTPLVELEQSSGRKPHKTGNASKPRLQGIYDHAFLFQQHSPYVRALAREWWVNKVHAFRFWRIVTLIACVSGYAMLTLPTLDIAQAVVRDLISTASIK